jgi:hypothetical protein
VKHARYDLLGTVFVEERIDYTGLELRSHFIRERTGIETDGLIAFIGRCRVEGNALVDLEDSEAGDFIEAERMLHFIGEHFAVGAREGNLRLRLLVAIVRELMEKDVGGAGIERKGDDLFVQDRKLTVAIATVSPVSSLMHLGVNIDPAGAPVAAVGLEELGIDPAGLARAVLERYGTECRSIEIALRKVRGVD